MLSEMLLQNYPNAKITLFDFSKEMLESAKMYFELKKIDNGRIKYVLGDFINDTLPNEKFDLIVSSYALHHIRKETDLRKVFLKIAKVLNDEKGTFLCVDMFLETGKDAKKKQREKAIKKWTENFKSPKTALDWANIIESEDTPATLPTLISNLYACYTNHKAIPLLRFKREVLATLYGMTKLSLEKIKKLGLYDLIYSWRDFPLPNDIQENEYQIDSLKFSEDEKNTLKR